MKTEAGTVGEIISLGARRHPGRAALRDRNGAERSYADLDLRTTRLAQALLANGLERGDRVAAWMGDCFEYVEVYLAAAKAGLVVCPVNARSTPAEATYLLQDSSARALVWTPDLDDKVAELDQDVWGTVVAVSVGPTDVVEVHDYERLLASSSTHDVVAPIPGDLYILGYTSGTTGRPKGAMLTHASCLAIARQNAFSFRMGVYPEVALTGSMSFVSVVPAHILCTLRMGGTVNIMGRWDPESLLRTIQQHRVTFTYIPSPLLGDVTVALDHDRSAWLTLEAVLHSASRASVEHLSALQAVIGSRLVEGWGMTENSGGLASVTTAADYHGVSASDPIFGSVGRSALDADVRLVDTDGVSLPHDGESVGELVIASPALMSGYWQNPEATAQALRDGWYHTGDLGSIDPRGYVSVSERRTDLIVSGGANVYPSEVERCISELAGVREVAVVGAPHPRWGQSVVAVVVLAPGAAVDEGAVIAHCRTQLAGYKKPSRVLFLPELPRTTSLKVARGQLRDDVRALLDVAPVTTV
ncbi:AMP-binding protein [Nocardioides sp.]|uniref:class I adenylate-forming enzyme family protein n=1 Tax=Nocardioides sp. TaxID=35761 RepID=UPI0031FE8C15|nr:AMP-binding protein [Nocardioides sp.]